MQFARKAQPRAAKLGFCETGARAKQLSGADALGDGRNVVMFRPFDAPPGIQGGLEVVAIEFRPGAPVDADRIGQRDEAEEQRNGHRNPKHGRRVEHEPQGVLERRRISRGLDMVVKKLPRKSDPEIRDRCVGDVGVAYCRVRAEPPMCLKLADDGKALARLRRIAPIDSVVAMT